MKIPSQYFQFNDRPTLILVTATQDAVLYWVENGKIEKNMEIVSDQKEDRDKPGVFRAKRPNMVHHGVAFEDKQQKVREKAVKDFLLKLNKDIKEKEDLVEKAESIFIFTSDFMEREVLDILPEKIKEKIDKVFTGNYTKEHQLELIKKINSFFDEKKVVPTDEEANKILKRGKK